MSDRQETAGVRGRLSALFPRGIGTAGEKGGEFVSRAASRLDRGLDAAVDGGAAAFNKVRRRSGEVLDRIDAWSVRASERATAVSDRVVEASSGLAEKGSERVERLGRRIQDAVEQPGGPQST
ncbi:hypothetical protein [uncultured Propionibacterium sp.]|uniref:hypothetical protein n=1 Tax=uncultured Propionibacterium sp. TaxID=218066 RepID=UPI00292E10C5|nr:hypothetical protein [uncultured Propionibacterium sp.]